MVADLEPGQPAFRDGKAGIGGRRWQQLTAVGNEPDPSRGGDPPEEVAAGTPLDQAGAGFDRARPELWTGKIHEDATRLAKILLGAAEVGDHPRPVGGVVVRAIDPHAVHAAIEQLANEQVILGCLARHRDHDPDGPLGGFRAEQLLGVRIKQLDPFIEPHGRRDWRRKLPGAAAELVKHLQDDAQRGEDVRLGPAQGGEAEPGQPFLELTDIVPAEGEVMEQVSGARPLGLGEATEQIGLAFLQVDQSRAKGLQLVDESLDLPLVPITGRRRSIDFGRVQ